jgi:polysaccharide biosynthesis protein PslH
MTLILCKSQMLELSTSLTDPCQRLRILFLAPFAPNLQAGHGGGRVIAQLINHLAQRHAIGLCYLRSEKEQAVDNLLKARCDVIEEVVIPESNAFGIERWLRRLQIWRKLLAGKPLWAIDRYSAVYERRLKSLLQTWRPDIVQLEFHVMGQYLPTLAGFPAPRILVEHEPGTESARESLRSRFTQGRVIPILDLIAWKRFERRIVQQVQTVVVFTDRDRRTVREFVQKTPMVQIPLGTEIPEQAPRAADHEPPSLLFVGNFKHAPNLDAADRLINHIFPPVLSQLPETRLFIVGDHLPADLMQPPKQNIVATGYVPDVTPYLDQAALVVVPLRLGGGMRVKVLEALAAGKAVVASALAVEGLDLVDGEHVILAESDQEFVDAISDLLRNPEKRLTLARQAHTWASTHLSAGKVAEEYEKLYRCLLKC